MEWIVGVVRLTEVDEMDRGDLRFSLYDIMQESLPLQTYLDLYYPENHPDPPRTGRNYEVILREVGAREESA